MVVNREGVRVNEKTANWLSIVVGLAAVGGPPATYAVVQATQGERLKSMERYRDIAEAQRDRISDKLDDVVTRLSRIEGKLGPG